MTTGTNPGRATLITVAPTGAESEKSAVPALPVTLEELVTTAKECREAGAAVIHVHIRDDEARPTLDLGRLNDTVHALREATDLIVQLSTGGAVTDSFDRRLAVLDARPDACSLTCGTVNFGDDVFMNPWGFMTGALRQDPGSGRRAGIRAIRLRPHRRAASAAWLSWASQHGGHVHCDLVMGVPGGMPGDAATLVAGGGGAARRRDLVRDRHRPDLPSGPVRRPGGGRPSAGRHGGHRYLRQRPGRWKATRSWSSGRPRPPSWRSARP